VSRPRATIRLQFHRGFTFANARSLVPYFASLGVSHIYASPIMTARPGSQHGYDVIDPTRVNPELGGEAELLRMVEELRQYEMGLIVDIVPNHMAIGGGNRWWMDVLSRGRGSRYAKYFDIDWSPPDPGLAGKVLLPILSRPYGEVLEAGEITLRRAGDDQAAFAIHYFDHVFPIAAGSLAADATLVDFDPASARGHKRLHELLEQQHYRLAWWRVANDEINWRRFFDINELSGLRVEDDEVFETVHATVLRLYAHGLVDGLRIDHIDGLSQPEAYCRKLRTRLSALESRRPAAAPGGPYLVVEKILARDEALPKSWATDGTTGYDFMDQVSALLHDEAGEQPLTELWHRVSGRPADFDSEEQLARRQILERSFSAQRDAVVESLYEMAQSSLVSRDSSRAAIRRCLTEILVHFPVYRIYARVGHASPSDRAFLAKAITRAQETCLPGDRWLVTTLGKWLAGEGLDPGLDALQNVALARFQQLSAPLCAKAVEDTAFYRYGRLLSRNDVGFDVRQFACSAAEFHRKMTARAAELPHAMLATATHDHKRGEDVRARLAVLSELPREWSGAVERWLALSAQYQPAGTDLKPSPGDLAILFQTIVGAWPLNVAPGDELALAAYCKRIVAWQLKALREAKLHSDWSAPNEAYERTLTEFIGWLFTQPSPLLDEIASFARRVAPPGSANGLAQVLLKLTAPGVPDIYQGTDYWDLSLVDPDNRSPVDFALRQRTPDAAPASCLAAEWWDGRIKHFLIRRVLAARKERPELFSQGVYLPLETAGPMAKHVVAFARWWQNSVAIVACCRLSARLADADDPNALPFLRCTNTEIHLPQECCGNYSEVLQGRSLSLSRVMKASDIVGALPVAFLTKHSA